MKSSKPSKSQQSPSQRHALNPGSAASADPLAPPFVDYDDDDRHAWIYRYAEGGGPAHKIIAYFQKGMIDIWKIERQILSITLLKFSNDRASECLQLLHDSIQRAGDLYDSINLVDIERIRDAHDFHHSDYSLREFVEFREKYGNIATENLENIIRIVENYIDQDRQSDIDARLNKLKAYARLHGAEGIDTFASELFADLFAQARHDESLKQMPSLLPATAPELYTGLRGPETPPEFVQRVYGEWLGQGLTRAHIRQLDPKLYTAIDNWSRRNEWPSDVDLPKLKEQNDRWVDRFRAEGTAAALGPDASLSDFYRLQSAAGRRKGRSLSSE